MRLSVFIKRLAVCMSLLAASTMLLQAHAQTSVIPSLSVRSGQTIELTVDTSIVLPEFSWILTKDHTFVTAQRNRFFQSRQIAPGTYLLDVNVQDPARTRTEYYTFQITVTDVPDIQPLASFTGAIMQAKITTLPEPQAGYVHLPSDGGFVVFDARQSIGTIAQYNMDLDNTVDADKDGKFDNDADNAGTYNQQSGWPLIVFIRPVSSPRTVTLTVKDASGKSANEQVRIAFDGTNIFLPHPEKFGSFTVEKSGLTVGFVSDVPLQLLQNHQLLFEWDFGDGAKSLLDAPVHTYSQAGEYTVSLIVRDLVSSQILFSDSTSIKTDTPVISSSVSSVQQSSAASSAAAVSGFSFGSIGNYIKVGLIVFFIVIVGLILFALLSWIKKLTAGRLQQTLEKVEDNLFRPEKKTEIAQTTNVMPLKRDNVPSADTAVSVADSVSDRESAQAEFKTQERDNAVPLASSGPVPSWLSNAPTAISDATVQDVKPHEPDSFAQPSPASDEKQTEKEPSDEPLPAFDPPVAATPETPNDAPVPDWLLQAQKSAEPLADAMPESTVSEPSTSSLSDDLSGLQKDTFKDPDATAQWALEQNTTPDEVQESQENTENTTDEPETHEEDTETLNDLTPPVAPLTAPTAASPVISSPIRQPQTTMLPITSKQPLPNAMQPTGLSASQKRKRRRKKKKAAQALGAQPAALGTAAPAQNRQPQLGQNIVTATVPPSTPAPVAAPGVQRKPQESPSVTTPVAPVTQTEKPTESVPTTLTQPESVIPVSPSPERITPSAPKMPLSAAAPATKVSTEPIAPTKPETVPVNTETAMAEQPAQLSSMTPLAATPLPEKNNAPEPNTTTEAQMIDQADDQQLPDDTPVAIIRADSI